MSVLNLIVSALILCSSTPSPPEPMVPKKQVQKEGDNPTPGLSPLGERIALVARNYGVLLGEKEFNGRKYTVRQIMNTVVLFNDKCHVIVIAASDDKRIVVLFDERSNIDVNSGGPTAYLTLDGVLFTIKLFDIDGGGKALVVFDKKGQAIFGIVNPDGVIMPRLMPGQKTRIPL